MQRSQHTGFPLQDPNDVAQAACNSNGYSDSFPRHPQYEMLSRRQSVGGPSNSARKPHERKSYSLVSGQGTNVAGSDTKTQLNPFTTSSGYRARQDVPGSWSLRRATLVNDKPRDIARTLSGAEEGHTDLKATATAFSSLSRLSRNISNPKRSGLPVELLYPSDLDAPNLFSPMTNVVHSKGRGSFSSRVIQDDQENARPRPRPVLKRQASNSYKDTIKDEPVITKYIRCVDQRREFILKLAKALLTFGAPSHRIESQLTAVSEILDAHVAVMHIPSIIMVTLGDGGTKTMQTIFVRANGRIALTSLDKIHAITRDVCRDYIACDTGSIELEKVLNAPPLYPLYFRCFLAFICSSIICAVAFGGSVIDMWISGICAAVLQYLGLYSGNKVSMLDNVYEISVSMLVSFVARALSTIPGNLFCYSAMSSAGVVHILPGFTILVSALELTSRNILCGSVRMVYAIIYTLFLGFSLTIGSDLYFAINPRARREYLHPPPPKLSYFHGALTPKNGTYTDIPVLGTFGFANVTTDAQRHVFKGCFRNPDWPWWRHPFPWWTLLFLVPIYSLCSSLSNLQHWRSRELYIMVLFSCASYAANTASNLYLPDRGDIVSAVGAVVIGSLGNTYSRIFGGTAFTSMVTGVLFLVPSGIAQAGGLSQNYANSAAQYTTGFGLAVRMVEVAIGVTIGLFVSQLIIYTWGRKKERTAHFAF